MIFVSVAMDLKANAFEQAECAYTDLSPAASFLNQSVTVAISGKAYIGK
jgi:hypothetical protein